MSNNTDCITFQSEGCFAEIAWYLQDLATKPVFSIKDERALIAQLAQAPHGQQAETIRTALLEANLLRVVSFACRYQPCGLALADLVQEGNLALIEAARQFDPQRSSLFRSFAARRICWRLFRAASLHLQQHYLATPSSEPIVPVSAALLKAVARCEIDEETLVSPLPEARFISLTTFIEQENRRSVPPNDMPHHWTNVPVEGNETDAPYEHALAQERAQRLRASLEVLSVRERFVLTHRYLLDRTQTLEEVGREIGVSRERVRQIEERSMRKIRQPRVARSLRPLL